MSQRYSESGVSLQAGYESVEKIKKHVKRTQTFGSVDSLGAFGGMFNLFQHNYKEPVLVSGTDGVGSKILCAIECDQHNTIGIDAVAMCVNDVIVQGAKPLFFLDYLALHTNIPTQIEQIVSGIADGCQQANCALIGGETAEMKDLYAKDHYDLAGFCVGVCEKESLLQKGTVEEGSILIGLASSGLHSNGYSLVRQILFKEQGLSYTDILGNQSVKEHLLTPTKIYVREVLHLLEIFEIQGMSHITGGGFYENVERMLGENQQANIDVSKIEVPEIFTHLQRLGKIEPQEMYNVFNMGIGFVLAIKPDDEEAFLMECKNIEIDAYTIGTINKGEGVQVTW